MIWAQVRRIGLGVCLLPVGVVSLDEVLVAELARSCF